MFRALVVALILTLLSFSHAGAEEWKLSLDANLTFTQNTYSDNWVGGEVGAMSWAFTSNSLAEKQISEILNNRNTLKLMFGQTHNQDNDTKHWEKPVKSTDLIDFETIFRFSLGGFVDPFVGGRLESQFLDASDAAKKRYINPLQITESAGAARVFINEEKRQLTARLGGALRQHVDRDLLDPVTDTRKTVSNNEGGIIFDTDFNTTLSEDRITYSSKLTLFKAFYYSKKDEFAGTPREDYWKAPDLNWEHIFTANITKYLMVNLYIQLLYDKEIDLGGRFKQTLALGLTYKFI